MQCLPWLKPTAPNKMYNAKLMSQREPVFSPKGMAESSSEVSANWGTTLDIVRVARDHVEVDPITTRSHRMSAWMGIVPARGSECPSLFELARRLFGLCGQAKGELLRTQHQVADAGRLLVLFPQILDVGEATGTTSVDGLGERTTVQRKRDSNKYYGEFTDPSHRAVAVAFNGPMSNCPPPLLTHWQGAEDSGVILAYIVSPEGSGGGVVDPSICTVGLTIYLPDSATSVPDDQVLTFEAIDRSMGA